MAVKSGAEKGAPRRSAEKDALLYFKITCTTLAGPPRTTT